MPLLAIHILGSRTRLGYTTLEATSSVDASDRTELEDLSLAGAKDAESAAQLLREPVMVGRPLRSGRIAVSRMLPGGTDDKGRPTVEIITLIANAHEFPQIASELKRLASDVAIWNAARAAVGQGLELPAGSPPKQANQSIVRAFDVWLSATARGAIGVLPTEWSHVLLELVANMTPADQGRCRWGIGLLSISAPVDICTTAPGVPLSGARQPIRLPPAGQLLDQRSTFAEYEVVDHRKPLPASTALFKTSVEQPASSRQTARRPAARPVPQRAAPKSSIPTALIVAGVAVFVAMVGLIIVLVLPGRKPTPVEPNPPQPSGVVDPAVTPQNEPPAEGSTVQNSEATSSTSNTSTETAAPETQSSTSPSSTNEEKAESGTAPPGKPQPTAPSTSPPPEKHEPPPGETNPQPAEPSNPTLEPVAPPPESPARPEPEQSTNESLVVELTAKQREAIEKLDELKKIVAELQPTLDEKGNYPVDQWKIVAQTLLDACRLDEDLKTETQRTGGRERGFRGGFIRHENKKNITPAIGPVDEHPDVVSAWKQYLIKLQEKGKKMRDIEGPLSSEVQARVVDAIKSTSATASETIWLRSYLVFPPSGLTNQLNALDSANKKRDKKQDGEKDNGKDKKDSDQPLDAPKDRLK